MRRSLAVALVCWSVAVEGHQASKAVEAVRVTRPPTINGVLDDECWRLARASSQFVLLSPEEGVPASNQTFVQLAYDTEKLYVGLMMSDAEPGNIEARVVPRDGRFAPRDLIGLLIDTYHDHASAYGFYINPLGIQHDYQMSDDGANGYRGNNKAWDGVWRAEAAVHDSGWTAEIEIPFSTIAFAGGDSLVWGFNVERLAISGHEVSNWSPITRADGNVLRISRGGHITGIHGVEQGLRLEVLPYAAAGFRQQGGARWSRDLGVDAKWSPSTQSTLDIAVNPDFAHVEADEAEVNLSRFELDLPERRPFFAQDADLFGRHNLIYSRRIYDPDLGIRLTGRGSDRRYGLLAARDRAGGGRTLGALTSQWSILSKSHVGVIAGLTDGTDGQHLLAMDTQLRADHHLLSGYLATTNLTGGAHGVSSAVDYDYDTGTAAASVEGRWTGADFDLSTLGLVDQDPGTEVRTMRVQAGLEPRLGVWAQGHVGQRLEMERRSSELVWDWRWTTADLWLYSWSDMFTSLQHTIWRWSWQQETYQGQTLKASFDSGAGRAWTVQVDATAGDQFDFSDRYFGTVRTVAMQLALRPNGALSWEGKQELVWEYLPTGSRDERKTVRWTRLTYFPSRSWLLRAFLQQTSELEATVNLLASYEMAPKSRAYLAYNLQRVRGATANQVLLKITNLYAF